MAGVEELDGTAGSEPGAVRSEPPEALPISGGPVRPRAVGSPGRRLLIVSDMHVGRDCKEITGFQQERPAPEFDTAFMGMLDFYTEGREREWKIVFAGDFIDFIEVVVVPEAKGPLALALTFDVTQEERSFGLGSEAERVLVKVERTLEFHRELFARIGRFVKRGGEIVLLRGNHDVEFYWPKVQRVFRRRFADIAFRDERLEIDDVIDRRNEFQQRIIFAPWIYYEAGRIYVEHGHQYDEYCSFDHWLYPLSPENPRRIDTPVSAFAMRFFVNLLNDFAPHNVDHWRVEDYWRWLVQKGLGGALYTTKMAIGAGYRMIEYAFRWATFGRVRRYSKEHKLRLAAEAASYGIEVERLRQVDQLHHMPVSRNLPELMRLLLLDRLLVVAGTAFLAGLVLLVVDSVWLELIALVLVLALGWFVNRKLQPRRHLQPGPKQAMVASRIAEVLGVPLVVMGHSHVRRHVELGGDRRYVNTGCWLPPRPGRDHVDPLDPCTCKLSHLVVEGPKAELRVYCKASRTVRLYDTDEKRPDADREPGTTADLGTSAEVGAP